MKRYACKILFCICLTLCATPGMAQEETVENGLDTIVCDTTVRNTMVCDTLFRDTLYRDTTTVRRILFAPRTNLLLPLLNVGVEIPVGGRVSLGIDYYYPWWLAKSNRYCLEMLGLFVDCKVWFGKDRKKFEGVWRGNPIAGHAIGVYAGAGYYDFQWQRSGYQGEYVDCGIDYTYSLPVARDKLRIQFNVGFGCIYNQFRHYVPDSKYEFLIQDMEFGEKIMHFYGPTRIAVSLVVPICGKENKK